MPSPPNPPNPPNRLQFPRFPRFPRSRPAGSRHCCSRDFRGDRWQRGGGRAADFAASAGRPKPARFRRETRRAAASRYHRLGFPRFHDLKVEASRFPRVVELCGQIQAILRALPAIPAEEIDLSRGEIAVLAAIYKSEALVRLDRLSVRKPRGCEG